MRCAVEVFALESDRVNHHFVGARAIDHRAEPDAARRVVAVGEDQNHAAAFDAFQLVEALADRVPQPRAVAVVEILDLRDQLVAIVGEAGVELNLVVERADASPCRRAAAGCRNCSAAAFSNAIVPVMLPLVSSMTTTVIG